MNKNKAFTIIEMILVITVIGILFGLGITTFREGRDRFVFNDSLARIVDMIKMARNYAVTSRAVMIGEKPFIPPEGYGVHIDQAKGLFTLFANTGPETGRFDSGDIKEETYDLPRETSFQALLKNNPSTALGGHEAVIIFKPPLAETFISNNGDPADPANIVETLVLKLAYAESGAEIPASVILINRTAGFPEIQFNTP